MTICALESLSSTKKVIKKMIKQKKGFPKTDVRYWEAKVAFQTPASRTYSVQIQHANRRSWINLGTATKSQAAIEARRLYEELRANGWDETLRRRRPDAAAKKVNVTIGEYLDAVKARSAIYSKTIESYGAASRYDNARCPIVCTRLRSAAGLRVCESVVNRNLMPAPLQQLPAVCTSLRCCGPELAACVVHCATGGRPARRPPEQPALACGGG